MRRPSRNDAMLLVGATVAVLVIFQRPIRYVLESAHTIEDQYGLAIVPGVVILAFVILANVLARRSDERIQSSVARVTKAERDDRTAEMGRLVGLGHSLATARSMDGLRDALRR